MKKEYELLKTKFEMPSYDELNKDFDIYSVSSDDDIIREILKKVLGVIDNYTDLLEDIIQPDSRFHTLKEANVLGKSERQLVNFNYNKLMYFNRAGVELQLNYSEEEAANFIKKVFFDWQAIKKDLLKIVNILKESWSKNTETELERGYFG